MFPKTFFPRPAFPAAFFPTVPGAAVVIPGPEIVDGIYDIRIFRDDDTIYLEWQADAAVNPTGTVYQIYINGILAHEDEETFASMPMSGRVGERVTVDILPVGGDGRGADRSGTLASPRDRARLDWYGGTWVADDLMGYHVYQSVAPGGPVDFARPVDRIPADMRAVLVGFGRGPFGRGPFGRTAVGYTWTSRPLKPGDWTFAVAPFDGAGNESEGPPVVFVTIAGPPDPPPMIGGKRLWIASYDAATRRFTLGWGI